MVEEAGNNNFFESEFAKTNSKDCNLLIEFAGKGFSFSIIQNSSNTILYSAVSNAYIDFFNISEQDISELISTEKLFNYSFRKVIILIDNIFCTLVPETFFNENSIEEIVKLNHNLPKAELVFLSDFIPEIEYQNLFVSTKSLASAIKNNFISPEVFSTESILIDFLNKKIISSDYFHVHISEDKIHCCFFENKVLKFNNSFICFTPEDILFNLLNVYKQLGLNNEKEVLNISGNILENSDLYNLLFKYIKFINLSKRPFRLNYSDTVLQIPEQYFFHHYAALL